MVVVVGIVFPMVLRQMMVGMVLCHMDPLQMMEGIVFPMDILRMVEVEVVDTVFPMVLFHLVVVGNPFYRPMDLCPKVLLHKVEVVEVVNVLFRTCL